MTTDNHTKKLVKTWLARSAEIRDTDGWRMGDPEVVYVEETWQLAIEELALAILNDAEDPT